jgi:hypothetical protein
MAEIEIREAPDAELIAQQLIPEYHPHLKDAQIVYLFTKSRRYFWDAEAVRQPVTGGAHSRGSGLTPKTVEPGLGIKQNTSFQAAINGPVSSANLRNHWWIPSEEPAEGLAWLLGPEPLRGMKHYAAFPTEIPRRCFAAGSSEKGSCPTCGAPWRRVVRRQRLLDGVLPVEGKFADSAAPRRLEPNGIAHTRYSTRIDTLGWEPSCACPAHEPIPCVVADIFCGSGSSGVAARRLDRRFLGLDVKPEYVTMSQQRIENDAPLFNAADAVSYLQAAEQQARTPSLFDLLGDEDPDGLEDEA